LVDHLFVFEGEGVIRDFPGNYSQYRLWQDEQYEERSKEQGTKNKEPETRNRKQATSKRLSYNEKREFELLEKEIAELTKEKQDITQRFSEGNIPYEELEHLTLRIAEISTFLDIKEMRWLELSEMIDAG